MRRAGLSAWSGGMICLPNRNLALAVSSMRDFVRNRIGAPLTIMTSPCRSSRTRVDIRPFLDGSARGPVECGTTDGTQPITVSPASCRLVLEDSSGRVYYPTRRLGSPRLLLEQAQQRLRCLVRQRQGLSAQLLAD